jgi:hypothetical protein
MFLKNLDTLHSLQNFQISHTYLKHCYIDIPNIFNINIFYNLKTCKMKH